jgi:M6 family metalloprotease-like protein
MVKFIKLFVSISISLLFTACGGGSTEELISQFIQKEQLPKQKAVVKKEPISTPKKQPKANTKPVINIPTTITKEQNVTIEFIANAFDQENDALSYIWREKDTILSDKKIFTKDDLSIGEHNITLKVTDERGKFSQETITVTIRKENGKNDAPRARDQKIITDEDRAVTFTLNVSDLEGDNLSLKIVSKPQHGTIKKDGTTITYSPIENFRGSDEIRYKVSDGKTDSNEATVYIKVRTINDAPIATIETEVKNSIKLVYGVELEGTGVDKEGTIEKYEWLENGKVLSTKESFKYLPETEGNHKVTFRVTDNEGLSDEQNISINTTKELPLLLVRVEFNDYQFKSPASVWSEKIFNTQEGGLNDYYDEISYGKLRFVKAKESEGTANDGVITVKIDMKHPGEDNEFVKRLIDAIKLTDNYIDFSRYDLDKNHAISRDELQISFAIAGGERATNAPHGVWAKAWCFNKHQKTNTKAATLDDVILMQCSTDGRYSMFGERHKVGDEDRDATIGIIAHELGHAAFNLTDLYDTSADMVSEGIGYFGLMGSGNWGRKSYEEQPGSTPTHMTGFSKVQANFIKPTVVNNTKSITIKGTSYPDAEIYKIATKNRGEFFLLENRANEGYDRGLYVLQGDTDFQGGLLITHIDKTKLDNEEVNHKLVDVEEANNPALDIATKDGKHRGHINNLYFSGNKDSFTPKTSPNSKLYSGEDSGISITNISDSGSTMSADIDIQN